LIFFEVALIPVEYYTSKVMTTKQTSESDDIYGYQRRFIFAETSVLSILTSILLISWFPNIFSYVVFGVTIPNAMKAATYLSVTLFSLIFLLYFFKKELKNSKIILTDELVVKKKPYKVTHVAFAEITDISIKKVPFLCSFLIIKARSSLVIPFIVENMTDLASKIQMRLIENGKFDLNETKIEQFKAEAAVHDVLYKISLNAFPFVLRATVLSCLVSIIIAYEFWEMAYLPVVLWGIAGLFFPPITYGLASLFVKQKFNKKEPGNTFSESDFSSEFYTAALITFVIYLTSGILFKTYYPW
jgi:hypothetical protein